MNIADTKIKSML